MIFFFFFLLTFFFPLFPDIPCMKRVCRDKKSVVTLVSSQKRRALAVPLINRLSTADEPVVNRGFYSSVGFKNELDCLFFRRDVQDSCLRYPGVHERQISPGRTEPSTSFPARPCAAAPRPAQVYTALVLT